MKKHKLRKLTNTEWKWYEYGYDQALLGNSERKRGDKILD